MNISQAQRAQKQLNMYINSSYAEANESMFRPFFDFCGNILPDHKLSALKSVATYPLPSAYVADSCFDEVKRAVQRKSIRYDVTLSSSKLQTAAYEEIYNFVGSSLDTFWSIYYYSTSSVIVVDMKDGENPSFFHVDINNVISYERSNSSKFLKELVYSTDDKVYRITEEYYEVYDPKDKDFLHPLERIAHNLGFAPCFEFWLSEDESFYKRNILSKVGGLLKWYVFYSFSKRHLDTYGAFPIYSGYAQRCEYENTATEEVCHHGFMYTKDGLMSKDIYGNPIKCPVCGGKRIVGAGSFIEVPIPSEDQPDLSNPVQVLGVDRSSLDYTTSEVERLKNEIVSTAVNLPPDILNKASVTEDQVRAVSENYVTKLSILTEGFERVIDLAVIAYLKLKYGNAYIHSRISLSRNYFTLSENTATTSLELIDKFEFSPNITFENKKALYKQEFSPSTDELKMLELEEKLEPYKSFSIAELQSLCKDKVITLSDLQMKVHFYDDMESLRNEVGDAQKVYELPIETIKNYLKEKQDERDRRNKERSGNNGVENGNNGSEDRTESGEETENGEESEEVEESRSGRANRRS